MHGRWGAVARGCLLRHQPQTGPPAGSWRGAHLVAVPRGRAPPRSSSFHLSAFKAPAQPPHPVCVRWRGREAAAGAPGRGRGAVDALQSPAGARRARARGGRGARRAARAARAGARARAHRAGQARGCGGAALPRAPAALRALNRRKHASQFPLTGGKAKATALRLRLDGRHGGAGARRYCGLQPRDLVFERGRAGKPELCRAAHPPARLPGGARLRFNLSHTPSLLGARLGLWARSLVPRR